MKGFIVAFLLLPGLSYGFKIYAPLRINSELVQAYNKEVILDIYKKIGIKKAEIVYIAEEEINAKLKSGDFDAVLSKISAENNIPNSIKIDPPIIKDYTVYRWKLKGSETKKTGIVVGSIRGVMANTKSIIKNRKIFKKIKYFKGYEALLNALKTNEVDSVLLSQLDIQNELSILLQDKIEKIPGALITYNINHYIHKNHALIQRKLHTEFKLRDQDGNLSFLDFSRKFKKKK